MYYLLDQSVLEQRQKLWSARQGTPAKITAARNAPIEDGSSAPVNLVFVVLDTLRADSLRDYGGGDLLMPHLNDLASESYVLTDVMANSSWTRASVASFFTGLLPEEHGAVDRMDRLGEEHVLLAEKLRILGYQTNAFNANFGAAGKAAGFAQGFDNFYELSESRGPYANAETVVSAVQTWLDTSYSPLESTPTFLYIHFLDPHAPYLNGGRQSFNPTKSRPGYLADGKYLDVQLGRLFRLIESELIGPTVVVVTSDHGEEFGEHGEQGHGHALYREVLWLPVVVNIRGVEPERRIVTAKLEGRDLFHLLLWLSRDDGTSLEGWAEARNRERRYASVYLSTAMAAHRPYLADVCMRALEHNGMFVVWSAYGSTIEVYDFDADPNQRFNVAWKYPEIVASTPSELDRMVQAWTPPQPVDVEDETEKLLRALGYINQ